MRQSMRIGVAAAMVGAALFTAANAVGHCEIPCGIYGDKMRFEQLREHFETIEKSMRKIDELSAASDKNYNQIVRWVNNKEAHANKVQEIVYQYFLNQRIKPVEEEDSPGWDKYVQETTLLHKMLVAAMKCKQGTDTGDVERLRDLLDRFEDSYFGEEEHQHLEHHHD